MSGLDIFSLIVLLILVIAAVAIWAILGIMPGRIAKQRNHPQAEAINVCGWWGVLTLGILLPLAYIWAYTKPIAKPIATESKTDDVTSTDEAKASEGGR